MTVAHILAEKGRGVTAVAPKVSLAEVAAILSQQRIGAVLVVENEAIRGILSERDIVRAVAAHGSEALRKLAVDCMTAPVVTCTPQSTVNEVMHQMTAGRFRHLPVLEDGRLAGIVSIGDVVKRRIEEVQREADQIREYIATA